MGYLIHRIENVCLEENYFLFLLKNYNAMYSENTVAEQLERAIRRISEEVCGDAGS